MKKLLFAVFILMSYVSFAQTTGYFRYDSVRIQRGGGNATLIIENATRNVTNGFLQNYGEGRTRFARALDSVWVDGDSLRFRYGLTTIAVLAPGGGPSFGFFNDETSDQPSTIKTAIGNYTLTGVDTLTFNSNVLLLPNIPSGIDDENSEILLRSSVDGSVSSVNVGSLLFGVYDNVMSDYRGVDINGFGLEMMDLTPPGDGLVASYRFWHEGMEVFLLSENSGTVSSELTINEDDVKIGMQHQGGAFAGLHIYRLPDPEYMYGTLSATGNLTLETDSLILSGTTEVSDTTDFKPLVMDDNGLVRRSSYWPGGSGSSGGSIDTSSLSDRIDDAFNDIDSINATTVRFQKPNGGYVDLLAASFDIPDDVVFEDSVQTLTNKRWVPRIGSTTSSATPSINVNLYDIYKLTAQAVDITSFTDNLSGTPTDGQILVVEITGTATRAISWGSSFVSSTTSLPTATVSTDTLTVVLIFKSSSSYGSNKWVCASSF